MTLSDKIFKDGLLFTEDVKEFIRQLKESIPMPSLDMARQCGKTWFTQILAELHIKINELAGDKLNG